MSRSFVNVHHDGLAWSQRRMALSLSVQRSASLLSRRAPHLPAHAHSLRSAPQCQLLLPRRTFLSWLKPKPAKLDAAKRQEPVLTEDNLFHAFSKSPFPAIRARGEAIQKLAPCPVCAEEHHDHAHAHAQPKAVKFECPNCGWPTHCSEEHWQADEEHRKYCGRLKEVNEDEHDLRSGRRLREFELPGMVVFYVDFTNSDTTRSRRSARHGSSDLVFELGHVLVHATIPVHGHGTLPTAC